MLQRQMSSAYHHHGIGSQYPLDRQQFAYGEFAVVLIIIAFHVVDTVAVYRELIMKMVHTYIQSYINFNHHLSLLPGLLVAQRSVGKIFETALVLTH